MMRLEEECNPMPNIGLGGAGCESPGFMALTADSLFEKQRSYRTNDVTRARADIARVFFRHSLSRTRTDDGPQFCHRGARLWRTSFNYICYGADVQVAVDYVDRDLFVFVLPLSGDAEVDYLSRGAAISRGQYVLLDPMAPFRFRMSPEHCHLAIGVPAALVRESTGANLASRSRGLHPWACGPRTLEEADGGLLDYIAYLCRQLDQSVTHLSVPAVARSVEESFLTLLFASLGRTAAASSHCTEKGLVSAVPAYVKRAEAYMLFNLTEDIRLEDVVAAVGIPTRTLYNGFQRFRGVGPMQWLRIQRLERARQDLAEIAQVDLTVTDVANRYGASNYGRFARAYFDQFGELPSETLRRARSLKV
jgi:AraC-like DNA-binding protein